MRPAGVVLTRAAQALPLPGLRTHPLLGEGSALLAVGARLAEGGVHMVFLCPLAGLDSATGTSVTALTCPLQRPHRLVAVVVLALPETYTG